MSCSSRNLAGVQKPVEKRSFIVNSYSCMAKKMGATTANSSMSAINTRGTNNKLRDASDKSLEIHKWLDKGTLLAEHLTDRWERTSALHRARQIIVTVLDVGSPGFFAVELNKVASISTEDALLLLAVSPPSDRMFHLDNKELLNEAKCIEVGQMVEAYHGETGRFGVVVSKGTVPEYGRGIYFGVQFAPEPTYSNSSFHRTRSVFEGNFDQIEYLTFQSLRVAKDQNNIGNKLAYYKRDVIIHRTGVIIDMDGFAVPIPEGGHLFLCKELGVSYLYKDFNVRYTFQVGNFYELTPRVRATVAWVMRHIHGMKFENKYGDLPQSSLPSLLGAIQTTCITETGKHYIAYKGGHYERNMLRQVGIPYYDLESIGCPRYEQLLGYYNVIASPTCGLHCHILRSKTAHCPMAETMLFKKWLLEG